MEKDKTIKIFLASSEELKEDRVWFGDFVQGIDKIYQERGKRVDLCKWEFFDAANNDRRKQDEYNEIIRASNMFLALFHKRAGKYTLEEYDVAMDAFRKSKKFPKVYVYCKKLGLFDWETPELKAFKAGLSKEGEEYFCITYSTKDQLHLHFLQQLLMVENSLDKLKLEEGTVTLEGMHVADIDNLPFAMGNKDYQRISAELSILPKDIENARQYLDEHPDNDFARDELQKKLNRYNALKEEFARLQKALFEMSQRIAAMQRLKLIDKLHLATEAFEVGNMERVNTLLDEIINEAETHNAKTNHDRKLIHQYIEALLLRVKTVMAEVKKPIEERIKQVLTIYAKADQWAKESALPDEKYRGLLCDYSDFLRYYGLYKEEAESIHLRLISLCEKLYGKEHADTATSYNNIGTLYNYQGNYAKALGYYEKALDIDERVLGHDHPNTATSYNNIGAVYDSLGDYAKALEYYGKALNITERVLGPDHTDTATSYNNIGMVYYNQGDYVKALEYHEKALDIYERVLGPDHPDTATSYNNIGGVYDKQGDYAKALKYFGKALNIYERELGPDHPDTATSYNNISGVYDKQGDYAKALKYFGKALNIYERVLGHDHPETAKSYNNIGMIYRKQGDYAKAIEYHRKALDILERVLGPDHPDTAMSYNNIGALYYYLRDYAKALEYLGKALDIWERVLGPDHPYTTTSYAWFGEVYDKQGDYAKALEYYGKALDIYERKLGPDHPDTAQSYNNIGLVYDKQGDYAKALENLEEALDIRERVLGPDHPDTATSYNNIGLVYAKQGDYYATSYNNIGAVYYNHYVTSYNNIGVVYYNKGGYAKALEYLGKALDIWERVLGPDHPNTKTVRRNIEICQMKMQG